MPKSTEKAGRPARGTTKLQAALDAKDLTQAEVALAIGMPANRLSLYCTGSVIPHPGAMKRLSKYLGVRYEDLFDWDDYDRALEEEIAAHKLKKRPSRRTKK